MTTSFLAINNQDGTTSLHVTIDNGDGSFTSMSKETYDANRTDTPTQAELDAIAKAQADATAQAEAEATAQATFEANLAATNAKLEALGLTAQDISVLLNAAKA
jgi:hypothetical protein